MPMKIRKKKRIHRTCGKSGVESAQTLADVNKTKQSGEDGPEVRVQIKLGREFMREYEKTFLALAK